MNADHSDYVALLRKLRKIPLRRHENHASSFFAAKTAEMAHILSNGVKFSPVFCLLLLTIPFYADTLFS